MVKIPEKIIQLDKAIIHMLEINKYHNIIQTNQIFKSWVKFRISKNI